MHVGSNHEFASASRTGNPIKMKHSRIKGWSSSVRVFIMNADFLLWSGIILILANRWLISFDGDLKIYILVIILSAVSC